jgi:RimJ/RimL family protein N-acetyltransferase
MLTGRLACQADFESYYILKADEENIRWTGHSGAPERIKIYDWYIKNISRKDRIFFLFMLQESNECVGYLYMDYVHVNMTILEVSLGVNSRHAGKGYGTEIIKFAVEKAKNELTNIKFLEAWIADENLGSVKAFLRNEYIKTEYCKDVRFGDGTIKNFHKYKLQIF